MTEYVGFVENFKNMEENYTWQKEKKEEDRGRDNRLVPAQWMLQPAIKSEQNEAAKRINAY